MSEARLPAIFPACTCIFDSPSPFELLINILDVPSTFCTSSFETYIPEINDWPWPKVPAFTSSKPFGLYSTFISINSLKSFNKASLLSNKSFGPRLFEEIPSN